MTCRMMKICCFWVGGCFLLATSALGQIVWTEPALPSPNDQVTLYYDASQGNGELNGVIPVYIHTGVITSNSSGPSDWQNVQTDWGVADPDATMDYLGGTLHSFDFNGLTLADFYQLDEGELAESLAMVFRNAPGSLVGRNADGSDIFYGVSDGNFAAQLTNPSLGYAVLNGGESLEISGVCSALADLTLTVNGEEVATAADALEINYTYNAAESGGYEVVLIATQTSDGATDEDSVQITVLPEMSPTAWPPNGSVDGITYLSETSVRLQLVAPGKDFVFVTGDFNNWTLGFDYMMTQTPDQQRFFIEIDGLTPGETYRFHYHILPDDIRVTDAHTELVLYPNGDQWISNETFPDMPSFPNMQTANTPVGVLTPGAPEFAWTDGDFVRPHHADLVIYELLVRDFTEERNYQSILDTLDYLDRLGINALELMPVNEFNGNDSWGYNTTFYWAPDKAYGTKAKLQELINECHNRGIAVILDLVFNHADQPNPFLMMYWNAEEFKPTTDNPWFNVEAPHAQNWFYDWNHESNLTREFVKRTLDHWLEMYHMDGFRWDFTQGMSQTPNGSGAYDASRINILNDYGDHVWEDDESVYMILEHWCDQAEEAELAGNGFMFWSNSTHDYQEAAMGYSSNLGWANYQAHNMSTPQVVSYAESHDEERLMFKTLSYGASNDDYDATDLVTALRRMEAIQCFNIPLPGPKMIWQFQELGYDYSINTCSDGVTIDPNCRVDAKPVRWDYRDDPDRYRIHQVIGGLAHLKTSYPGTFRTTNFTWDVGGYGKRLILNGTDFDAVIVANFSTQPIDMIPGFTHEGEWHDYFSGESINVDATTDAMNFAPGEYHVFLDADIETPEPITEISEFVRPEGLVSIHHTTMPGLLQMSVSGWTSGPVEISIYNTLGQTVLKETRQVNPSTNQAWNFDVNNLISGTYIVRLKSQSNHWSGVVYINI